MPNGVLYTVGVILGFIGGLFIGDLLGTQAERLAWVKHCTNGTSFMVEEVKHECVEASKK
jgi:hypothetical protein